MPTPRVGRKIAPCHALGVHQREAGVTVAVSRARSGRARRTARGCPGPWGCGRGSTRRARPGLETGSNVRVGDEVVDGAADEQALLAVDGRPLHRALGVLRLDVPGERVLRLVVVVVAVEELEVQVAHGSPPRGGGSLERRCSFPRDGAENCRSAISSRRLPDPSRCQATAASRPPRRRTSQRDQAAPETRVCRVHWAGQRPNRTTCAAGLHAATRFEAICRHHSRKCRGFSPPEAPFSARLTTAKSHAQSAGTESRRSGPCGARRCRTQNAMKPPPSTISVWPVT